MRLLAAVALAALLAAPAAAQELRPSAEAELAVLASQRPLEIFTRARELTPAFIAFLRNAGHVVDDSVRVNGVLQTNAELLALLRAFKSAQERATLASAKKMGVELGSGYDPALDPDAEPFSGSELDRLLSWQARVNLRLDGVGVKARYKHPRWVRSLDAGAHVFMDLPAELGLGHLRDEALKLAGKEPYGKELSGYEVFAHAHLTQRWETHLRRVDRRTLSDSRDSELIENSLDVGFSPHNEDPRREWRGTWWLGAADQSVRLRDERDERGERAGDGLALSAGYALRRVLGGAPIPGMSRVPLVKNWGLDHARASLFARTSPLEPIGVMALADVTTRVTKHFHVLTRAEARYAPQAPERRARVITRLGLKYKP